jgi:hypothetical protein
LLCIWRGFDKNFTLGNAIQIFYKKVFYSLHWKKDYRFSRPQPGCH